MNNHNPNSRAIVSALRCDHMVLRAAAAGLVDKATFTETLLPINAVMKAFGASRNTAKVILRERALVNKTGARRS
jgi:hypothetical protein